MGTITSGTGLISGLNTTDIINQLMAIEGKQKDLVQAKIDDSTAQKTAYLDLTTRLAGLQITSQSIGKPSFFSNATATSSDESVLTATASAGAAVGSYQFRVARLVQAEQLVSGSFADPDKATVGAGKLTVELGGGQVTQANLLSDLLGGKGVSRGPVRITDRSGASTVIDLSDAVSLDDVVKKINTSVDISVKAAITDNKLVLTDASGATTSNLTVADLGSTTAAADLGIDGSSTTGTLTGAALAFVGRDTRLASLNDGNGVSDVTGGDFHVVLKDASAFDVDLKSAVTVGDAIDAISTASAGRLTAAVNADGTGLNLTDSSGGGGTLAITELHGSTTAADLGLTATPTGNTVEGTAIQAGLGTVLLKTLNGGAGVTLGTIHVANRLGAGADIDLSGAKTLQDTLDTINAAGAGVTAAVNASGNGIQLTDTTAGAGNLVVTDAAGTGAAQLGIAGTFTAATPVVNGANLQRKWVSGSTTLADYNGGKGVTAGEFTVTAANGTAATIDIDPAEDLHLGDVIAKINDAFKGKVVAAVNAHGDGLSLTDASGGAGTLTVRDNGGTTAADLNLTGAAVAGVIDGSQERTIDVTATDTLEDVQKKINDLDGGVTASIINDGSGAAAYRLSLNATHSGSAGQVTFDAGATKLGTRTLVKAQDAAVFVGSADTGEPLLITANKNQVVGAVKGVTINLTSVSAQPVTISVTNDVKNVSDALQQFTDNFNTLVDKVNLYTEFTTDDPTADQPTTDANGNKIDPTVGTKLVTTDSSNTSYRQGVLLGDFSVSQIQDQLYRMMQTVVPSAGKFKLLSQVGLSVADEGKIAFDPDKFAEAYATDPDSVKSLFTATSNAITNDTNLKFLNDGDGIATAGDDVDDFQATLKDGTKLKVAVGDVSSVGGVIAAINAAGQSKLHAELDTNYKIVLTDLTTGTAKPLIEQLNGSQFLSNLGIPSTATAGAYTSRKLVSNDPLASASGGIGVNFQQTINKLINPVDGLITNESKTIDTKISTYQDRITDLSAILDQKRQRLQDQFNNLEEVLSKLKTQQSSLGSIGSASAAA